MIETSNKRARFAVSPVFLIDIMKHGLDAARVVDNPLPEDAIFVGAFSNNDLVWIVVESESFAPLKEGEVIPQLPKTTFTKVR